MATILTPIQYRVLRFLRQYQAAHGYAPTYEEIRVACGLSSKSVVTCHLDVLQQGLYIRRRYRKVRNIEVLR